MDLFKNFKGFFSPGRYLFHSKGEEPWQVAERLFEQFRGIKLEVDYNRIETEYKPEFKYSQEGMFTPCTDFILIPEKGILEGLLKKVNTDNISITVDSKIYEVQKIVIGSQFVTEVSVIG